MLLGFWGAGQISGLTATETDKIVSMLLLEFAPPWAVGFLLAGVLAALMSSLDGQTLSVSTLVSEDFIATYREDMAEYREVWLTRLSIIAVLAIVYVFALIRPSTIVGIAEFAFSGYALLAFPLLVGIYWRRANKYGAWAGLIWGTSGLLLFQTPLLSNSLTLGFGPFIPLLITQIIVTVAVTYMTDPAPIERVEAYFDLYEQVW